MQDVSVGCHIASEPRATNVKMCQTEAVVKRHKGVNVTPKYAEKETTCDLLLPSVPNVQEDDLHFEDGLHFEDEEEFMDCSDDMDYLPTEYEPSSESDLSDSEEIDDRYNK